MPECIKFKVQPPHGIILSLLIPIFLAPILLAGCHAYRSKNGETIQPELGFQPTHITLQSSFTRLIRADNGDPPRIEAYVALRDQFDDSLKALGRFRFELFRYQPAASDPRGPRFNPRGVQPFDLTDVILNQQHWDSATRHYRFVLQTPSSPAGQLQKLVIQVTFAADPNLRLENLLTIDLK